jgi:hypothetical protein
MDSDYPGSRAPSAFALQHIGHGAQNDAMLAGSAQKRSDRPARAAAEKESSKKAQKLFATALKTGI